MKRELKFRAFLNPVMLYSGDELGKFFDHTLYGFSGPIMQFAGLHDKNGKEIYEGDVCKCPVTINKNVWGEFSNRVVKWKDDSFCWVLDGEWAWIEFDIAFGDEGDYIIYKDEKKVINIEVIGNIYENPELIK